MKQGLKVGSHNAKGATDKVPSMPRKHPDGCVIHAGAIHPTEECKNFLKLTVKQRYEELKRDRRCFKCMKSHPKYAQLSHANVGRTTMSFYATVKNERRKKETRMKVESEILK